MISKDSNNLFRDLFDKILGIEDLVELSSLFYDDFASGGKCFNFLVRNRSNLITKAYKHDYRNWANHLVMLAEYGVGQNGMFSYEDLESDFLPIDFYKGAISFLAYLESDFNSNFDLSFNSKNLESLLDLKDTRAKVNLSEGFNDLIPFSHFYIIWNLVKNSYSVIKEQFEDNPNLEPRYIDVEYGSNPFITNISVSDSGPGIPMPKLRKIFREGFTSKAIISNEGFGLYGIKKIIDERNGQIGVITRNKGYLYHFIDYPRANNRKPKIWREKEGKTLVSDSTNTLFHILLPNR